MGFWIALWTVTWIVGLVVFAGLSVVIAVHGARDIAALFRSLRARHGAGGGESA